jgi:hypothetical protein
MGTPDHEVTTAVDVRPFLGRKWAALRAHASQLGPASQLARLPGPLREVVLGTEWFVRHGRPAEPGDRGVEDDLLAGVREAGRPSGGPEGRAEVPAFRYPVRAAGRQEGGSGSVRASRDA